MTEIIRVQEIAAALAHIDVMAAMERAFRTYSKGGAIVPPVGELLFNNPPGEAHIKYGYVLGDDLFFVKVATGFYDNVRVGLPANSGLVIAFHSGTGLPEAILLDEGLLTNVRTAAAGALAGKILGPGHVGRIGIIGTGVQASMQLEYLARATPCRDVIVWGRSAGRVADYRRRMSAAGFDVKIAATPGEVARCANLIVTATSSAAPLLRGEDIRPGTHITAMGSDTPDKNELDPSVLEAADLIVVDSLTQCVERGELHHALEAGRIGPEEAVELGTVLNGLAAGRRSDDDITIADLTGVAVQDIEICKAVLSALRQS